MDRGIYAKGHAIDNDASLDNQLHVMDDLYKDLWAMSACDRGLVASFASSMAWIVPV